MEPGVGVNEWGFTAQIRCLSTALKPWSRPKTLLPKSLPQAAQRGFPRQELYQDVKSLSQPAVV
jgi:hypothetical protein